MRCGISLNDFARNGSVLIKQIDGAHSVIAVRDDELPMGWVSDKEEWRKLLAGRDFHMVFADVRIGYSPIKVTERREKYLSPQTTSSAHGTEFWRTSLRFSHHKAKLNTIPLPDNRVFQAHSAIVFLIFCS